MPKSEVVWHSAGARSGAPYITVDTQGRIMLSASFRRELKAQDIPIKMYVGYDAVLGRIHLQRADTETDKADAAPYTFDRVRGYAKVTGFLKRFNIPYDIAQRYVLVDRMAGAYVFEK